ncbi:APC family permease [Kutzneria sp. CA-103260]|uniref:APC family permease n=1 Tax=Kutzneria sp. CA-103260 TaxID=2802641 RepID=UPI001BEF3765|nr:APC family permease [Kutzneria sp. CA-103260]QUQ71183.1 amino acid permease [Kutzneria sp. CA-103260]
MASDTQQVGLERKIGPWQATAINMTQMCGVGPFLTIPIMVADVGGPQAVFGWVIGAIIALADGLIWAELGASLPGAGGTYIYLREAFQYRTGRLMPFLFVWTAILYIPLIMSTGVIGLVQYLGALWPAVVDSSGNVNTFGHIVGIVITAVVVAMLYRKIGDTTRITTVFFGVMLVSMFAVIIAAYSHFNGAMAFTYAPGTFAAGGPFFMGLGAGLVLSVYDYLGYNTSAYLGGEVREPGKTLPRSIILSIVGIMCLYLLLQVGILGVLPWQDVAKSTSVATLAVSTAWGSTAADIVTVLIVVTAFASVFAGLLAGSRVPYEGARDKLFLPQFAKLHPKGHFPTVGLLVMGVITAVGSLFTLTTVINMLTTVIVLVQALAQAAALVVLRRRQPNLNRPYKMWLFPVPLIIAVVGWIYLYFSTDWLSIGLSVAWVVVGVVAFLIWARVERIWPFGPKEITEAYLTTSTSGA